MVHRGEARSLYLIDLCQPSSLCVMLPWTDPLSVCGHNFSRKPQIGWCHCSCRTEIDGPGHGHGHGHGSARERPERESER